MVAFLHLVRRAGYEPAFPVTGTGVLLLDDRRVSKLHRQLRRGGMSIPLRWLLIEGKGGGPCLLPTGCVIGTVARPFATF